MQCMFSYRNVYFCCKVSQGLRELKNMLVILNLLQYFGEINTFVVRVLSFFFNRGFLTVFPLFKINKNISAPVICAFL